MDGLEKLTKQLEEASRAFKSLDGEIAQVRVVPGDQNSVQTAIKQIEDAIDRKATPYHGNQLVASVVKQLKEKYRDHIIKLGRG